MSELSPAWVALALTRHLGGRTFRALLAHFKGDVNAILQASPADLRRVRGIGPKIAQAITEADPARVAPAMTHWQQQGIRLLTWDDDDYPPQLAVIDDAPPLLFALGDVRACHTSQAYAVIGTRRPSKQAQDIAARIVDTLVDDNRVIVSGLAMGIDRIAHMRTLAVPQGRTVSVLGSGILRVYPPENAGLAQAVVTRGALLCEVAPETSVNAAGLVARNRIITGLCAGVVVIETRMDGGAMHAARFARAQGRTLYAVDLPVDGNQALIRDYGAIPIAPSDSTLP